MKKSDINTMLLISVVQSITEKYHLPAEEVHDYVADVVKEEIALIKKLDN